MRSTRAAEQALRSARIPSASSYVCRACRAQAARQFHTTPASHADLPFFKRLQQTIFGSKETAQAEKSREEKQQRRLDELKEQPEDGVEVEVKIGRDGKRYEFAAIVDPTENKEYKPAVTWKGLEKVGSEKWVAGRADQGEGYVGFVQKKSPKISNKEWQKLVHHTMVVMLVLHKAGRPVFQVCHGLETQTRWLVHKVVIESNKAGTGLEVVFANEHVKDAILRAIPSQSTQLHPTDQSEARESARSAMAGDDSGNRTTISGYGAPPWMDVPFENQSFKAALAKRVLQLTGKRLPDSAISTSTSPAEIVRHLSTKEKAKKLVQEPRMQRLNRTAPNVQISGSRQTSIDREKKIGRWKIIEEELVRRQLPVTGHNFTGRWKTEWQ
ncbi:hypothetical protein LTR53_011130 [Teratosphaeriaceae sp. CCFEE 6253]|nr:hypothetical protein LTR53_011130 [Teratosphaeriaceae sp. CCFEE 6253]